MRIRVGHEAGRIGILERFSICVLEKRFAVLRFSFSPGPQLNQIGGSKHRGQTGTAASTRRTTSRTNHLAGIVTAAVFADARHIVEETIVTCLPNPFPTHHPLMSTLPHHILPLCSLPPYNIHCVARSHEP